MNRRGIVLTVAVVTVTALLGLLYVPAAYRDWRAAAESHAAFGDYEPYAIRFYQLHCLLRFHMFEEPGQKLFHGLSGDSTAVVDGVQWEMLDREQQARLAVEVSLCDAEGKPLSVVDLWSKLEVGTYSLEHGWKPAQ